MGVRELQTKKEGITNKNEGITHKTIFGHFFQIYLKTEGITNKNFKKRKNFGTAGIEKM
jgi:hypothetical protein